MTPSLSAIGGPDYGIPNYDNAQGVNYDVTVVSDRLTGLSLSDNLGRLIFLDNCDLRARYLDPFATLLTERNPANVYNGLSAYKMGSGGSALMQLWDSSKTKLGIDTAFKLSVSMCWFTLTLWLTDEAGVQHYGSVSYRPSTGVFFLHDSTPILTFMPTTVTGWVKVKLVIDPQTGVYQRLIVNHSAYDLTSRALATVSDPGNFGSGGFSLAVNNDFLATNPVYWGYFAFTRSEP